MSLYCSRESIDLLHFVQVEEHSALGPGAAGVTTVQLPTMCQWYQRWFERPSVTDRRKGVQVLVQFLPFCRSEL